MLLARKKALILVEVILLSLLIFGLFFPTVNATVEWTRAYTFGVNDRARAVCQTSDGGYVLAGHTQSSNSSVNQALVVRVDSSGNLLWNKTYEGAYGCMLWSVVQTADGGFAAAGILNVTNATVTHEKFWLLKIDSSGNLLWNQTYGGASEELARAIIRTSDGGYALGGYTETFGAGVRDVWLVKTDANGNMQWNQTLGSTNSEKHGEINSNCLFIYDRDECEAWLTFEHEVYEFKFKEVTYPYRTLVNSLIEAVEKLTYGRKEKFLEFLPQISKVVAEGKL